MALRAGSLPPVTGGFVLQAPAGGSGVTVVQWGVGEPESDQRFDADVSVSAADGLPLFVVAAVTTSEVGSFRLAAGNGRRCVAGDVDAEEGALSVETDDGETLIRVGDPAVVRHLGSRMMAVATEAWVHACQEGLGVCGHGQVVLRRLHEE